MEIHLNQDSVINKATGEVMKPQEFVENLRDLERSIDGLDERIGELKAELKKARDDRETAVAKLRGAIRQGEVLPLLERGDEE